MKANTQTESERRWYERVSVDGAAAVLQVGYLGVVYELIDISMGGARLKGARALPNGCFDLLVRAHGRYLECRARSVWDERDSSQSLGVEFESIDVGTWLSSAREDEEKTQRAMEL